MSEFDKRLKAAAERYEENLEDADSPVCSAELERRVENLLTQPDKTGRERTRMKNGNTGRMRPKWTALIAAAFGQRRKTLTNALAGTYPKEAVAGALEALGLRADVRGERLTALDFCRLAAALHAAGDAMGPPF